MHIIKRFKRLDRRVRLFLLGIISIVVSIFIIAHPSTSSRLAVKKKEVNLDKYMVIDGRVGRGESLYKVIVKHGGKKTDAVFIGKALKPYYNPRRMKVGDQYRIEFSSSGKLASFHLIPNPFERYGVVEDNGKFKASREAVKISTRIMGVSGSIQSSLYESLIKKGVSPEVIVNFAEIFAWDIDFFNDPRNNDTYWLVWEDKRTERGHRFPGTILGAEYNGKITGKCRGIHFKSSTGKKGYYNFKGKSLRRSFLRAPLRYKRISSHFSYRRFHPILRYYRPHTGIDYAAPKGTPIETIGDGVVTHKAWKGQAGKTVIIKHNSVYTSQYSHLSRYGKGIKVGKRVTQGQVVGFVGSTGLSTGPHLDFRFKKFGKSINFLKLKLPPVGKISKKDEDAFKEQKRYVLLKVAETRFKLTEDLLVAQEKE